MAEVRNFNDTTPAAPAGYVNVKFQKASSTSGVDSATGLPKRDCSAYVPASPLTTKGDIYTRGSSAEARLAVGEDGQVLTADSTEPNGVKWADAPTGGGGGGGSTLLVGTTDPWASGTPATIAHVQSNAAVHLYSTSSNSLSFTSAVTAGNLLVVAFARLNSVTVSSVTDTLGTTYSLVGTINGQPNSLAVYAGIAPSSGANTVSVTFAASEDYNTMAVSEFSGAQAVLDGSASTIYGSSSPVTQSVVTTLPGDLIYVAQAGYHSADTFSAGGGFTIGAQANSYDAICAAYRVCATATTYNPSITISGAGADNAPQVAVAFKAIVTGTPGTDGNFYINTSTKKMYGPKASGAWPTTSILG
jgi:hypothetical protein